MALGLLTVAASLVVSRALLLRETADANTSLGSTSCCLCTNSDDFEVHPVENEQDECVAPAGFVGCTIIQGARDLNVEMNCTNDWFSLDESGNAFREIKFDGIDLKSVVSYDEARKKHFKDVKRLLLDWARMGYPDEAKKAEQETWHWKDCEGFVSFCKACCLCTDSDVQKKSFKVHVHFPALNDGICRFNWYEVSGTTPKCTKLHAVPHFHCSKSAFQHPFGFEVKDEAIHEARMVRFEDVKHVIQRQALMAKCAKQTVNEIPDTEITQRQASLLVDLASSAKADTQSMGAFGCKFPIKAGNICNALTNKKEFEFFFGKREEKYECTFAKYKKDTTWSAFTGEKPTQ